MNRFRQRRQGVRGLMCESILGLCIFFAGAAFVMGRALPMMSKMEETPRAITPLPVPRVSDLEQFGGEHRERLFWGTYRPMAYLGIRSRTPESLLAGLMWTVVRDGQVLLRHYYEDTDNLTRGTWLRHDGSTYGQQVLVDRDLKLTNYFLKSKEQGSFYGGDWVVRIKVEDNDKLPRIEKQKRTQSVFFYVAEEAGTPVNLWPKQDGTAEPNPFVMGSSNEIGGWQLHAKYKVKLVWYKLQFPTVSKKSINMNYAGLRQVFMPNLTQSVQDTLDGKRSLTGSSELPNTSMEASNVAVIQLTGTLPFEVDMVFISGADRRSPRVQSRVLNLSGPALDKRLVKQELAFEDRFAETFKLHKKVDREEELETGKVALSNMLGGIGYFYGQSRIEIPPQFQDRYSSVDYWLYWPASLYTAVPSQPIYPRGFLWDEGFHQLLISRWDRNVSKEIIANWLDLINVDGWIPREQILGDEARSKVPAEFINQKTDNANPPALLLALRALAETFISDQKIGKATHDDSVFFKTVFPRVQVWFDWFNTTQLGKQQNSYYWRGRTFTDEKLNPPTLTSGMDDYPRASHPSSDERHVDLRCWIANAANNLAFLAQAAGASSELLREVCVSTSLLAADPEVKLGELTQKYENTVRVLTNFTRLNELHYDQGTGRYYDYGNHSEKVELRWRDITDPRTGLIERVLRRMDLEPPKLGWVPQFGLNSLFPFAMHIIPPDSPILAQHLGMLEAPELMWTGFGLRSLGTTSSIYMKYNSEFEAPYWRGPVWISTNYLVLSALHSYSQDSGPYREQASVLYQKLRRNLIRNIVERYQETGFMWENYDNAAAGKGQGAHPFTGWTSLVLLMMGEIY